MILGFTGTSKGLTKNQSLRLMTLLATYAARGIQDQLHHGDCIGADAQVHDIAKKLGYWVGIHPGSNHSSISPVRAYCHGDRLYPTKYYLQRNKDIVNSCEILIACPESNSEVLRSGTWSTVRYPRKIGRPVIIIWL